MSKVLLKANINQHVLSYQDVGDPQNDTIVFIHGFPFDQSIWQQQIDFFKTKYRVITYDIRGHGSSESGNNTFGLDLFADDLIGLMNHLEIKQAIVCGLSLGGYILLNAIGRFPERFKSIILNDTKCEEDTIYQKINRLTAIKNLNLLGIEQYASHSLTSLFTQKNIQNNFHQVNFIKNIILQTSIKTVDKTLVAMAVRKDTCSELEQIKVPTLIIVGKEDALTPINVAQSMKNRIKDAHLAIIENAAHLPNLENESDFNAAINHFLTQISTNHTNSTMINQKILELTNEIRDKYPELLKYLNEMPISIPNKENPEVHTDQLKAYYNQLLEILNQYKETHEK
ncbi:MAG: alpha/beta fold hydrolase [Bacteroidota bacterium]|nr:alpha/beta fold hydrolase [Bacteroidota bacterium]